MRMPLPLAPTALLLLGAGLAALLASEVVRPLRTPSLAAASPPASVSERAPPQAAFAPPPLEQFAELGARPLFVMSRRAGPSPAPPAPPAPARVVAAPPPPPPPPAPPVAAKSIILLGIVGATANRIALLRPPNAAAVVTAVEGASVAGWEISKILTDRVLLQWNATEEEISFPKPGERTATPGGSLAPPPPPQSNSRRP